MKCPTCNAWVLAIETRQRPDQSVRRRYQCANEHRFSTVERVEVLSKQWRAPAQTNDIA